MQFESELYCLLFWQVFHGLRKKISDHSHPLLCNGRQRLDSSCDKHILHISHCWSTVKDVLLILWLPLVQDNPISSSCSPWLQMARWPEIILCKWFKFFSSMSLQHPPKPVHSSWSWRYCIFWKWNINHYKVQNPNNHYLIFHGCPLSPI